MLSWVHDVERTSHTAVRLEYHHDSGVQTIITHARDLQGIRERWTAPTIMDGCGAVGCGIERVKAVVQPYDRRMYSVFCIGGFPSYYNLSYNNLS